MATLKDIAAITHLSLTTISRILNYDQSLNVTPETKQKVFDVADAVGYKKTKRTELKPKIALIDWYTPKQEIDDPYYLHIRLGIEKAASKYNLDLVSVYDIDITKPLPLAQGAIAVGKFDCKEIAYISAHYQHIVFVDSSPKPSIYDSITVDTFEAYDEAYRYLEHCGIHDIGYIGGREYTKTLHEPVIDPREKYFIHRGHAKNRIHIGEFNTTSGYELMKHIINERNLAKAYLVGNDHMAMGVLSALHEASIRVPEDVSIIGFNGVEQSAYTIPPLTTIKVDQFDLGEVAVTTLIERINGRTITKKIYLPTQLIIRQSTKEVLHETSY